MTNYNCIIIDDELYAIEGLRNYLAAIPGFKLTGYYTDPLKALMEIKAGATVDLIFLDVDMPMISGIELAAEIRNKTNKLIFTTAHSKYGYEAFEVSADAYLLKPYPFSKLAATISRLFPAGGNAAHPAAAEDEFFFVKDKNEQLKMVKIRYRDVILVESQQNYVQIYTKERKILTYMSLTEITKVLSVYTEFIQFQRSFIINKNHIDIIDGNTIKMDNGKVITVGDLYRKDFQSFLARNVLKARRKE